MISGEKIIFFGGSDWWYHNISSGVHLLRAMAKNGNDCLYVNPISLRLPGLRASGSFHRYKNKLNSLIRFLQNPYRRIWVFSPLFIPYHKAKAIQWFNTQLLRAQLASVVMRLHWTNKKLIVFAAAPTAILVVAAVRHKLLVYYLMDKVDKHRDIANQLRISELDIRMAHQADVLFTVSKKLFAHYKRINTKCYYVPHGVDFHLFNTAAKATSVIPQEMRNLSYPIIGYFGTLTESNDKNILAYMAEKRPSWNIVLIGEVVSDYSSLEKFTNIHFLGKKKLEELPNYGKHFDVCIMNWIMNEWMHYCSPLKVKEYLAMGKPVVSVPIPEVMDTLGDVVSIAASPQEFLDKVEFELLNDSPERKKARVKKVASETWESKMEEISNLVEIFLEKRKSGRSFL